MNDLDKVLRKLQSAKAPEGMEARILARLDAHTASVPQRSLAAGWWIGGLAVAALLLAVAIKEVRKPVALAHVARESAPQELKPTVSPAVVRAKPRRSQNQVTSNRKTIRAPFIAPVSFAMSGTSRITPGVESFPAPPEPLTAQEKLLIRVAHSGDREDFALLNLETFELAMAADKADFDEFLRGNGAQLRP